MLVKRRGGMPIPHEKIKRQRDVPQRKEGGENVAITQHAEIPGRKVREILARGRENGSRL